jgi:hypothetical protein
MKTMLGHVRKSWFTGFCLAAILLIVACNLYLLCDGQCVLYDYLRIPPIGWLIISVNLVAGLVLAVLKQRSVKRADAEVCSACHTRLRETWVYCPRCGREMTH